MCRHHRPRQGVNVNPRSQSRRRPARAPTHTRGSAFPASIPPALAPSALRDPSSAWGSALQNKEGGRRSQNKKPPQVSDYSLQLRVYVVSNLLKRNGDDNGMIGAKINSRLIGTYRPNGFDPGWIYVDRGRMHFTFEADQHCPPLRRIETGRTIPHAGDLAAARRSSTRKNTPQAPQKRKRGLFLRKRNPGPILSSHQSRVVDNPQINDPEHT